MQVCLFLSLSNFLINRLHLLTVENGKREMRMCSSIHKSVTFELVDKFGFDVTTYCGFIPQDNSWQDDWVVSYIAICTPDIQVFVHLLSFIRTL